MMLRTLFKPDDANSQAKEHCDTAFYRLEDGQYKLAIPLLLNAIALKPDYAKAYYGLACAYHGLNQREQATPYYEKTVNAPDKAELENFFFANALIKVGIASFTTSQNAKLNSLERKKLQAQALTHLTQAIPILEKLWDVQTYLGKIYDYCGRIYQQQGKFKLAIENFEKSIKNFRNHYNNNCDIYHIHQHLGELYYLQEEYTEALAHYTKAIEKQPTLKEDIAVILANIHDHLGKKYQKENQLDQVLVHYIQSLTLNPNQDELCQKLDLLLHSLTNEDVKSIPKETLFQAIQLLSKIDQFPLLLSCLLQTTPLGTRMWMDDRFWQKSNIEEGILKEILDHLIKTYPDFDAAELTKHIHKRAQDPKHTILAFNALSSSSKGPTDEDIHKLYKEGLDQYHANNHIQALTIFHQISIYRPTLPAVYKMLGLSCDKNQQYKKAITFYNILLYFHLDAQTLVNRGDLFVLQKKFTEAMADYTHVLEALIDHQDVSKSLLSRTYNNRGYAYKLQGNLALAITDFNRCILISPNDRLCLYNRGETLYCLGHRDAALMDLTNAIKSDQEKYHPIRLLIANIYYEQGCEYEKTGQTLQAIKKWSDAITFNQNHTEATQKLMLMQLSALSQDEESLKNKKASDLFEMIMTLSDEDKLSFLLQCANTETLLGKKMHEAATDPTILAQISDEIQKKKIKKGPDDSVSVKTNGTSSFNPFHLLSHPKTDSTALEKKEENATYSAVNYFNAL